LFFDADKYLPSAIKERGKPCRRPFGILSKLRNIIEPVSPELYTSLKVTPGSDYVAETKMTGGYSRLRSH